VATCSSREVRVESANADPVPINNSADINTEKILRSFMSTR
jgi:hypothetical protein